MANTVIIVITWSAPTDRTVAKTQPDRPALVRTGHRVPSVLRQFRNLNTNRSASGEDRGTLQLSFMDSIQPVKCYWQT